MLAMQWPSERCVELLLEYGAGPNLRGNFKGCQSLLKPFSTCIDCFFAIV